jgi:hypothetical protein
MAAASMRAFAVTCAPRFRRKIIGSEGAELVFPETATMANYYRDELVDFLLSAMRRGSEYEREDVIRDVATYLGFSRVTDSVRRTHTLCDQRSDPAWLESLGYTVKHGPEIAPGELAAERTDCGQILLEDRLRQSLVRLNPQLPAEAIQDAFRKIARPEGPTLEARNRGFHWLLVDGVTVEY